MSVEHQLPAVNTPRRASTHVKLVSVLALTAAGAFTVMNSRTAPVMPEATASDKEPALTLAERPNGENVLGLRLSVTLPERKCPDGKCIPAETVEFRILREQGKGSITIPDANGMQQHFIVDPDMHGGTNYSIASLTMKDGDLVLACNEVDYVGSASCVIPAGKLSELLANMKHQKGSVAEHTFTYRPVVMGFAQAELTKQLQIRKVEHEIHRVAAK